MTLTSIVSPYEKNRRVSELLAGRSYTAMLCSHVNGGANEQSTWAEWEAQELPSTNGYSRKTGTIGTGVYNTTAQAVECPAITMSFTAAGGEYTYAYLVVRVGTETGIHSLHTENPTITVSASRPKGYTLVFGEA